MELIEGNVNEEQGGFRKGKVCGLNICNKNYNSGVQYSGKVKKYGVFMDLEKTYDKVD